MIKDTFTHQIIGLAMETHRALGPGLIEEFYHQDLVARLVKSGIEHLSKPRRDLIYRGFVADTFEADLVFERKLIPELKALRGEFAPEHFTQLLNYSKFWRIRKGMLLDFGKPSLVPKRVIYTSKTGDFPEVAVPEFVTDAALASELVRIAGQCLTDIGFGYRETTWTGLMNAALRAEQIPFVVSPTVVVPNVGTTSLRCLVIRNQAAITVTALGQELTCVCLDCLGASVFISVRPKPILSLYQRPHRNSPPPKKFPQIQTTHRLKSFRKIICGFSESAGNTSSHSL